MIQPVEVTYVLSCLLDDIMVVIRSRSLVHGYCDSWAERLLSSQIYTDCVSVYFGSHRWGAVERSPTANSIESQELGKRTVE
jgi:hypothetical protein